MSVPILDDAYMARVHARRRFKMQAEAWRSYARGMAASYSLYRDPIEEATEQYIAGEIDVVALEARVDFALRCRPQGLTG